MTTKGIAAHTSLQSFLIYFQCDILSLSVEFATPLRYAPYDSARIEPSKDAVDSYKQMAKNMLSPLDTDKARFHKAFSATGRCKHNFLLVHTFLVVYLLN